MAPAPSHTVRLRPTVSFRVCKASTPRSLCSLARTHCAATAPETAGELDEWAVRCGIQAPKVTVRDCPPAGRGLVLTQRARRGELLVAVPQHLVLDADAATCASALAARAAAAGLPAWSVLAAALAELRSGGGESAWWPYVRTLPELTGCVLEWPAEQVALLLGSPTLARAQHLLDATQASVEELQPLLHECLRDAADQRKPGAVISTARLRWAFAVLLTRSVRLRAEPLWEALVPFADLANHDPTCQASLAWDQGRGSVVLAADQGAAAGSQVFISYGAKTSGELLVQYGFAPAPGANPADGYLLTVAPEPGDPLAAAKRAALRAAGHGGEFPLRMTALPDGCLQAAALAGAPCSSAAEVAELAGWLFQLRQWPRLDGQDTQLVGLRHLVALLRRAQRAYGSRSLPEDQQALDALLAARAGSSGPADSSAGGQRALAVAQVRVQERKVLARALFVVQQQLRQASQ